MLSLDQLIEKEIENKKAELAKKVVDGVLTKEEAQVLIDKLQQPVSTFSLNSVSSDNLKVKASSGY